MIDLESSLIKVIRNNFSNIKIYKCYIHLVKLLLCGAKWLGLLVKDKLKTNKILLFILKIIQLTLSDNIRKIYDKIIDYFIKSVWKQIYKSHRNRLCTINK